MLESAMSLAMESDEFRAPTEYTIDELARTAQVATRTIRFYQSRGALMGPTIRGRVAFYSDKHLERLKLIAQLQERGLRIDAIAALLANAEKGETAVSEWLGIEQQMKAPWNDDEPRLCTEEELLSAVPQGGPAFLKDLERFGLIERHGSKFLLKSPALLKAAIQLQTVGIPVPMSQKALEYLKKHVQRAVADLVTFFVREGEKGNIESTDPAAVVEALRTTGKETLGVIFGREMEQALAQLIATGQAATIPSKARKARARRDRSS
jgi:DNA-binding transcriptional MerR regulator